MADNKTADAGSGGATFATLQGAWSGDTADVAAAVILGASGSEGSWTFGAIPGDATNGLLVNLGSNNDVTNAGTFAVQVDGDALTALQLIDDAVHTDDAAFTLGTSKGMMMMGFAGTQSVNANDAAALACDTDGALHIADGGNSITVDASELTTLAGAVSGTEMQVDVVGALPAGTNAIGKLAANSGVDIGDVDVLSIAAGSNLVGDVGISGARTSGGTTFHSSLGTSTLTQIKGSAGQLYWLSVINLKASVLYLQIFNKASASVTLGTTTPDLVFPLPTQGDTNGAGFNFSVPNGIAFGTGISWAITTTETGSTTASANEAYLNAGYA